ncbi:MAG: T9SS type A sorting domain-containing protein [Bacteroidota bacterium]
MKSPALFLLLQLTWLFPVLAQPTFSEDIAPIIFNQCTQCHRPGEIGPMPFTNYEEVKAFATTIKFSTAIRYMPPWKADPDYRSFLDQRILSQQEIQLIADWVDAGAPEGDPTLTPPLPNFPDGSSLGTPDAVISMAEAFPHQGNNQDQYQVFVLPTDFPEDKDLAAIEFRPQNRKIAHHALLALDTTDFASDVLDTQDPRYGYESFGGFGMEAVDLNFAGWVPGVTPRYFPTGIGKKLFKGSDILLQVHYGPSAINQTDSSSVNLFFADEPVNRFVNTVLITPSELTNGPFILPPDQVTTFHAEIEVPIPASLINITPHMHLLGKSWEIYAVEPSGDTIPLIKIDDWDFNWQGIFSYPNLVKIPMGSKVHFYGTYDNTSANPYNPNDPPAWMTWGEGTEDEMFVVFLNFVLYNEGDENIPLSNDWETDLTGRSFARLYPIYPNPAEEDLIIGFQLTRPAPVNLQVLDLQGKQVQVLLKNEAYPPGRFQLDANLLDLPAGTYLVELEANGISDSQKLVVR